MSKERRLSLVLLMDCCAALFGAVHLQYKGCQMGFWFLYTEFLVLNAYRVDPDQMPRRVAGCCI